MKIYLASGFSVTNVPGRERELANKFSPWRRLLSYHFFITEKDYGRPVLAMKKEILERKCIYT